MFPWAYNALGTKLTQHLTGHQVRGLRHHMLDWLPGCAASLPNALLALLVTIGAYRYMNSRAPDE